MTFILISFDALSANARCVINVVLMLAQRRRRWANIKPTLDQPRDVDVDLKLPLSC